MCVCVRERERERLGVSSCICSCICWIGIGCVRECFICWGRGCVWFVIRALMWGVVICVNVAATRGYVHVYLIPVLLGWGYVHEHFVNMLLCEFCWCLPPAVWLDSWMTLISTGEMRRAFAMQKLFYVIAKNMLKRTTRHTTGLPCKSPMKGVHNVQK